MVKYQDVKKTYPFALNDWYKNLGYQQRRHAVEWIKRNENSGYFNENEDFILYENDYRMTQQALIFWKIRICPIACKAIAGGRMPILDLPGVDPLNEYKLKRNITHRLANRIANYIKTIRAAIKWADTVDDGVMVPAYQIKNTLRSFKLLLNMFVNLDELAEEVGEIYQEDPGRKQYFRKRYQMKKIMEKVG